MDDEWDESPNFTADTLGLPTQFGSTKFEDEQINYDGGFGGGFDQFGDKPRSRSNAGGRSCFKCGEEGHMARDCQTESSGRGGQTDGKSWNSWNKDGNGERNSMGRGRGRGRGAGRPYSKPRNDAFGEEDDPFDKSTSVGDKGCFKCGMAGHISRDCPSDEGQKRGCFRCGQQGHLSRDCPNPEASEEKKPRVPLYIPRDVNDEELFESGIQAGENFDAYENIPVKVSGADPIEPAVKTFESMKLRSILLENIAKAGYKCPTPIQKHAIPNVLIERDIMACAQTGSGKTAAFLLPMLQYILENNCSNYAYEETAQPTGLVVCPTRELALQIMKEARKFSCGSVAKCCVAYGGVAGHHQLKSINSGCHILVATPGRLKDFLDKGKIAFESLKFLVLDEADRMLDMGFLGAMKDLMNHSTMPSKEQRTTMMFSATFPNQIQELASQYLNNYLFIVVGTVGAANTDVHQEVVCVQKDEKRERLIEVIEGILANAEREKILIFVEQKRMADFVGSYLCERNYQATTIHGDRFQEQREQALATFRGGVHNILVATAVAARGLDIKGINVVINYDLPSEIDEYVHRIGRTGRVGNQGQAISFVDESSDGHIAGDLVKVLSEANQEIPDWLREMAGVSGHSQNYHTPHGRQYAAADIRKVHGDQQSGSNLYLGGPQEVQEEEEW